MDNLHKIIADLCEEKGISGYRLCKETGIQPSVLTDLRKGRQKGLSAANTEKIASYFGVSVSYLLGKEHTTNEMYERIEELCKRKGVNISQMCKEADVARGGLTDLKYNRTTELSSKTLSKISVYFGVSMDYLLGNKEKKSSEISLEGLSKAKADLIQNVMQMSDEELKKLDLLLQIVEAKK